jgi:hypothetical protein
MSDVSISPGRGIQAAVLMTTSQLTDQELAAVNITMQLNQDPRHCSWYHKAQCLFTETKGDIPAAHQAVKETVLQIAHKRLS